MTDLTHDISVSDAREIAISNLTMFAMKQSNQINIIKEVCWFITLCIENFPVTMLLDTGAGRTMLNKNMFHVLQNTMPEISLRPSRIKLVNASGEPMSIAGSIGVKLSIANMVDNQHILISDLGGVQGVLGMDYLQRAGPVDLSKGLLYVRNKPVFLHRESQASGYAITATQFHSFSPGECLLVNGQLTESKVPLYYYTLAPATNTLGQRSLTVSFPAEKKFFTVKEINTGKYIVRNTSKQGVNLYAGEVLAHAERHLYWDSDSEDSEDLHPSDNERREAIFMVTNRVDTDESDTEIGAWEVPSPISDCVLPSGLPEHLDNLLGDNLTTVQKSQLAYVLDACIDVFVGPDGKLGRTSQVKHTIDTGDSVPIRQAPRRLPLAKTEIMKEEVNRMLDAGVIIPSNSPWASPIVLVNKSDGSTRFCVDYRLLNEVTRKDAYPLPRIDECFDTLAGAKWFCTMDMASGFWQVEVAPYHRPKTAFTTQQGLYEFVVMPFGLCNAPATFERLMESVLRGHQWEKCIVYLDDVIVFGTTFEETLRRLGTVLKCFQSANLKLKPQKCQFFKEQVNFLGHIVSHEGVKCDPAKIEKVVHWPEPTSLKELQSFLGFTNYYRRFVEGYSSKVEPLLRLTKKNVTFQWDDQCQQVFQWLKEYFVRAPVLSYPQREGGQFILDTDASGEGIGAVLSQEQAGIEKVIAYASSTLEATRKRYCTTYRELYAVVKFVKHFRVYLLGKPFLIRTDHASLTWLLHFKDIESGMLARWLSTLSEYDFQIQHRAGRQHGNADGLSRRPDARKCKRLDCPICVLNTESCTSETSDTVKIQANCILMQDEYVQREWINDCRKGDGTLPGRIITPTQDLDLDYQCEDMAKGVDLEASLLKVSWCKLSNPQLGDVDRISDCKPNGLATPEDLLSPVRQEVVIKEKDDLYDGPHCNALAEGTMVPGCLPSTSAGIWPEPAEPPVGSCSNISAIIDVSQLVNWDQQCLESRQSEDDDIFWTVQKKSESAEKPLWRDILAESAGKKALWAKWNELEVKDRILYKKSTPKRGRRIVLPHSLRWEVFSHLHNQPFGCHRGITKVTDGLRARVYWPGMKDDVERWIGQCEWCQRAKTPRPKRKAALQSIPVSAPLDRVQLDIVGPLGTTANGNNYILVLVDYFTKWAEAWAIQDHTAQTVAEVIVKDFICRFGIMKQLHTDQGREFESNLFKEVCSILGIQKTHTAPYKPNSDGLVERMNKTVINMLKTTAKETLEWDEELPFVLAAYRSSVHESTRCTPNRLMLGRENTMPVDIVLGCKQGLPEMECKVAYVEWLQQSLREAHKLANEHLKTAIKRQKRSYGGCDPCPVNNFRVGDWVLRLFPTRAKMKLGLSWDGPYLVIRQVSPLLYEIQKAEFSPSKVIHCDHLKRYYAPTLPESWLNTESAPVEDCEQTLNGKRTETMSLGSDPLTDVEDQRRALESSDEAGTHCDEFSGDAEQTCRKSQREVKPPERYGEWISL